MGMCFGPLVARVQQALEPLAGVGLAHRPTRRAEHILVLSRAAWLFAGGADLWGEQLWLRRTADRSGRAELVQVPHSGASHPWRRVGRARWAITSVGPVFRGV